MSQTGPALLAHAVALVDDGDAAADHGGDEGRRHVAQVAAAFDHGGDQQIFGAGIHGGLQNVDVAAHAASGGIGEGGFADTRLAEEARVHGEVLFVDHHPGGQQLPHQFVLPDPLDGKFVRVGQVQGNAFNLDGHGLPLIMRHGGLGFSGIRSQS
jgi:hypothetical protein